MAGVALTLAQAVVLGGCSFSYQLDGMFSRERDAGVATGSIRPTAPQPDAGLEGGLGALQERDLAAARAAVSDALGKEVRNASVPWEDSATGARGTVTPLSNVYMLEGATCRDFLASYVRNGSETWLQGEACRGAQGRWDVRAMRPWQRT
jgi:surface antigen